MQGALGLLIRRRWLSARHHVCFVPLAPQRLFHHWVGPWDRVWEDHVQEHLQRVLRAIIDQELYGVGGGSSMNGTCTWFCVPCLHAKPRVRDAASKTLFQTFYAVGP